MQILKYGLKDGQLLHINDVENGLSCGCVCPSCGGVLEACQGKHNQYHFKHYRIADCNHGSETALHIMAKSIVAKSKLVYLPNIPIEINNSYSRGRYGQSFKGSMCDYNESYIEKDITPDFRCDVLLKKFVRADVRRNLFQQYEPDCLNVEIKVTHKVDFEKKLKIYNANLETIEIDLSDCVNDFDENKIRNIIMSGNKTELIYSPTCRNFYAEKLLGNYDKISYDRSGRTYFKKCMCTNHNEKIYLWPYIGEHICSYKKGQRERTLLCMGLYGDLDCNTVDKIIKVERKNDIVQYAELIVNGEKRVYFNNSNCPYFAKYSNQDLIVTDETSVRSDSLNCSNVSEQQNSEYGNLKIGMTIYHQDYGKLTIIDVKNLPNKTIIRVRHLNGETSQMNWNILCKNNMVKII